MSSTHVEYRELTREERRRLRSADRTVSSCGQLVGELILLIGVAGAGYLAGLLPSFLLMRLFDLSRTLTLTVLPFIGMVLALASWIREFYWPDGKIRRDLEDGRAALLHVELDRAIFIVPFEDEGDGYLLELDDSRVLLLRSQYLDELRGRFPCRRFTLTRAVVSGFVFDIQCSGERIEPESEIELRYFPKLRQLSDGRILEGSLDEVSELRQSRRTLRSTR